MIPFRVVRRFIVEYTALTWKQKKLPDNSQFVHIAYTTCLLRIPDNDGFVHYTRALAAKRMRRSHVITELLASKEYRELEQSSISPLEALFQARRILIQHHLPPAHVIVDLGGGATETPEGALRFMGYPYRADTITIVDLPPKDRLDGWWSNDAIPVIHAADGTNIRYQYGSMADLSMFDAESVDLVISGESIEHVSENDADRVFDHVFRILRPSGHFCLDTPNAALTRLMSPNAFIHPEHQKEYYITEIVSKLQERGFNIVDCKGICPMPGSLHSGQFNYQELVQNISVCDNPEEGFLFFVHACKPA